MVHEPLTQEAGVTAERRDGSAEAAAVDAVVVDVELAGDVVADHGLVEVEGVLHGDDGVALGDEEEGGRRGGCDAQLVGEAGDRFAGGMLAEETDARAHVGDGFAHGDDRVRKDHEVGLATEAVERIGGVGVGLVAVGAEGGGEMAAGGESPDADAVGIDAPLFGVFADDAHGLHAVFDFDGVVVAGRDAVVEDEGGHALVAEPLGDLEAFLAEGDVIVGAAGNDEDGGGGDGGFRGE